MSNRILDRFGARDPWTGQPIRTICTRQTTGTTDLSGKYIPGTPTTFDAQISVQPLRGRERENLPEGFREKEVVSITSDVQLKVDNQASQTLGDLIPWNGRQYLVIHAETADGSFQMPINYWEGYGALVEQDTQAVQP